MATSKLKTKLIDIDNGRCQGVKLQMDLFSVGFLFLFSILLKKCAHLFSTGAVEAAGSQVDQQQVRVGSARDQRVAAFQQRRRHGFGVAQYLSVPAKDVARKKKQSQRNRSKRTKIDPVSKCPEQRIFPHWFQKTFQTPTWAW